MVLAIPQLVELLEAVFLAPTAWDSVGVRRRRSTRMVGHEVGGGVRARDGSHEAEGGYPCVGTWGECMVGCTEGSARVHPQAHQ